MTRYGRWLAAGAAAVVLALGAAAPASAGPTEPSAAPSDSPAASLAGPTGAQTADYVACYPTIAGPVVYGNCVNPHPDVMHYVVAYCSGWGSVVSTVVSTYLTASTSCPFGSSPYHATSHTVLASPPGDPDPDPEPPPGQDPPDNPKFPCPPYCRAEP